MSPVPEGRHLVTSRGRRPDQREPRAGRHPHVLFFSTDGEVAALYRSRLPDGWGFSALRDRHDEEGKLRLLADADVVLHTDTPLTPSQLDAAKRLQLVHRQGVGLDGLDSVALAERGIALAICPDGTTEAVAEHTIMLMLAAARRLPQLHGDVTREGRWPKWDYRLRSSSLLGATVGLVGFGRIAQAVAHRLLPFGCRLLVYPRPGSTPALGGSLGAAEVCRDLDELFTRSDVVSLHCPLVPETRGLVDARRLALMPPGALLVNTARGGLVVEDDLVDALRAGRPAAAGLDVLVREPPPADHPLFGLANVVLTPHCGAGTLQAQLVKAESVLANVARFWAGEPMHHQVL